MRKWIYLVAGLVYAAAMGFSILVAIKPGAAIFHLKTTFKPEDFHSDAGYSFRYWVNLPPALFPPERALLFEDGQQLSRAFGKEVQDKGNGIFETDESADRGFYIYISPTGNSDPTSNGKTYRLYSASSLLTHTTGIVYFSFLLFGLIRWVGFAFSISQRSRLRSLNGLVQITGDFLNQRKATILHIYTQTQSPWRSRLAEGSKLLLITAASAYALTLMEWAFHVTKVSFMDAMSLGQKAAIFLLSGLAVALAAMAINLVLLLAERLLHPLRLAWLPALISAAIPAALLTSLVVLWLDSFTYTLFHFGILTSAGLPRIAYGVGVLLLFLGFYRWLLELWGLSRTARLTPFTFKWLRGAVLGLLLISSVLALTQVNRSSEDSNQGQSPTASNQELPNIILIGSDGVSAKNMSVYGYTRNTTPNIEALAEDSLLVENAYTNSAKTYGSIISLLTGKAPTRTRVIYPPDILQDTDSYQHLPGILKDLGYTTVQIGLSYYVDANTWNIQNAFDRVNQRIFKKDVLVKTLRQLGLEFSSYFILAIEERLANRLFQALYLETIPNPFSTVTDAPSWRDDRRRMDDLFNLLEDTQQPLFVHVHLLGTHGFTFLPAIHTFSAGQVQERKWMIDFYDDAILTYDAFIGELVEKLKTTGKFDQTILILYSDHAMSFQSNERIPLLIHFPADQYQGRIQTNVQNLDIAPTILDYMKLPVPEWMEGDSILPFSTQVREPLFAVVTNRESADATDTSTSVQDNSQLVTENFLFSAIQVFHCQRMYQLDLASYTWSTQDIAQHTAPCEETSMLSLAQIRQATIQFLESQGYDTFEIP